MSTGHRQTYSKRRHSSVSYYLLTFDLFNQIQQPDPCLRLLTEKYDAWEAKPVDEVEEVGGEAIPHFSQVSPQLNETMCHFIFLFLLT